MGNLPSNVILVGFMGSGKTSTGRELAAHLYFDFFEMDLWIEKKNKKKINKIFEEDGESYFRQQEKETVEYLKSASRKVVSTGGGSWMAEANRDALLKTGWCVWLKVSAENAWERIKANLSLRPLLARSENPFETLKKLLSEREKYYSLAHIGIDTNGKTPAEVAMEIVRAIEKEKPFDLSEM